MMDRLQHPPQYRAEAPYTARHCASHCGTRV